MAGWINDTDGNINLDFLIGLVIFLGAFLYLICMIPGIFLPYQTSSVDLGSIAYRTSCILAEDPGWYVDASSGTSGIGWEHQPVADLARVGLAVDKRTPNVLSIDKINALENLPYQQSRDMLGLDNTMVYNYSLQISMINPDGSPGDLLLYKTWPYSSSSNVESIDRIVQVREGEGLYYDDNTITVNKATNLNIGKSPAFDKTNVTVRMANFVTGNDVTGDFVVSYYLGPIYDPGALQTAIPNQDYFVKINNEYVDAGSLDSQLFNQGDIMDVIVNIGEIDAKYAHAGLNVSEINIASIQPSGGTIFTPFPDTSADGGLNEEREDYNTTNPNYRYFDYDALMTLRVWEV